MTDYGKLIDASFGGQSQALPSVVGSIDEDPDRAQRALDLAKATGVPSTSIYGDLDEFERQQKATLASSIVGGNPHLQDFVQSNPMVPRVANDDYGTLDSVSSKVTAMGLPLRWQTAKNAVEGLINRPGFKEGYGEGSLIDTFTKPEDWENHPDATRAIGAALSPVALALRTLSGVTFELAHDVVGDKYGTAAAQAVMDPGLQATLMGMGPHGAMAASILAAVGKFHPVASWIRNGREPPAGVMPELDKFRADQNSDDVAALKEATSEAQQSLTRERSPDLFKQFIQQHTDAEIGVSGDAVATLYGDKVPAPGDSLLGWVPDIEAKLNTARATGSDVSIPLSDWLTHVADNPEVMKALEDDIRVRPGGITANEVKLASEVDAANAPATALPEDVPAVRGAAALEPLLSIGDRKLELKRLAGAEESKFGPGHSQDRGFHDFSLNDEKGNPVGTINISTQKEGKQLYVENINGLNGLGPRDFGPALMRDILRQLKAEFPEAESITGHRVSGARNKAGTYRQPSAMPVVRLDSPNVEHFGRVLEGGQWETFDHNTQAYITPKWERSAEDNKIVAAVGEELGRIVPQKVEVQAADRIKSYAAMGQRGETEPSGIYLPRHEAYPIILYSLEDGADAALGTARHEAIHHLRGYGFFAPEEWSTLEQASLANDWGKLFDVDGRYPTGNKSLHLEESIADAYKAWEGARLKPMAPEVATIFEKMRDLFNRIRQRIGELLGKQPTWEDIFNKVSTGEVGRREGTEPLEAGAFNGKLSVPEDPSRVFERANALGMTIEQYKRYDELIQKQHVEDIAAATKRAQDEQARQHTKQWKEDRKALRQEVAETIRQRPDVAADLFFGEQELYGKKLDKPVKLAADALTDEQKAGLPRSYYGADGIHPDDAANLFSYGSGDAMVQKLIQYNSTKQTAGMSAKDFVSRVTDIETDRQMKLRHGVLEDNIMDAIKEQVAGETQLNILAEETHALGMRVGQAPLDKAAVMADLKDQFAKTTLASVSSDRYLAAAGRAGKAAEMALLQDDAATAFQAKQRQFYATVLAKEAVQLEREQVKFEKLAKRYSKPFDPKSGATIDADFSLYIRQILSQVDRPYGMSVQGLEKAIEESGYEGLKDFVEKTEKQYSIAGIELPVADYLFDEKFHKNVDDLTVDEFRGLNQSVTALNTFGRNVQKVTIAGEKADRKDWIAQATQQLRDKFDPQDFGATGKPGVVRHYLAALTNLETMFGRFDGRDPNGIFTKMFTYPAARAANYKDVLLKEYSKDYDKAGPIADAKRKVESPLVDPLTNRPLTDFTRENIATIISNMGNPYNWRVFTEGWKIDPEVLRAWVEKNSTPEDFARAQAVGDIFSKGKDLSDTVYKNLYGISPESIQVAPVTMHGVTYPGWYHPIIYDPIRSKLSKLQSDDPSAPGHSNFWPSTSNAYTKRRTGAVDVISLSQDMVPIKLNQMLHDVAFREFVNNTAKVTRDTAFRNAITERYGPEYVGTVDTWLNRIAGNASFNSDAVALATRLSGTLRSNVISTYIAFSATTIEKHGFTAAVMSAKEVGAGKFGRITAEVAADSFKHAVSDLFGKSPSLGDSLWQFVKKNSEEIQRRDRNFQETLGGQHDLALGRSTLRNRITEIGSKGVAFSDMLSAVPLWLAKYREIVDETGDAGRATDQADRAVRRAHGSTAITNQPTIVSNSGPLAPWLTTIYGFFGTNMQRRFEIAHDLNDAYKLAKGGEIGDAAKMAPGIMSSIFTYVIWPGIVEEAVTSQFYDDKREGGVIGHALAFTLGTAASTFIGIRDLAYGLLHNREPQVGLISSPLHDVEQLLRDVKKDRPMNKQNAGKLVQDAITVFGDATGMGPKHVGTALRYGIDVLTHEQRPKTGGDIYRGIISGKQEKTQVQ